MGIAAVVQRWRRWRRWWRTQPGRAARDVPRPVATVADGFVWTLSGQAYFHRRGFPAPTRCRGCLNARLARTKGDRP
jgi:hypothetical protein